MEMNRTLQVSQVNRIIKDIVDNQIVFEHIRVVGEISSFSSTRGTAYFVIKDSDSMLNCVMFGCKYDFQVGDNVVLEGSIKYYAKGAKISLNVYKMELAGQGELYQQFLLMKQKLEQEGLFDESRKMPIPNYIKRIGVVTSKTGAVIQDIINVRTRRNPNLDIVLYDVQVQGMLAKEQIIKGINFFSEYDNVDCVIVARGGGSLEDLQPFNEEEVARAVYNCKKPVISAVGHETDFTIIDFVSDLRAPTPSAAAELVAFDVFEAKNTISYYQSHMDKAMDNVVLNNSLILKNFCARFETIFNDYFVDTRYHISSQILKMENSISNYIKSSTYSVLSLLKTLDNLNPARVLSKGYSVIKKQGIFQKDFSNIEIDDIINVENDKLRLTCQVKDKISKI